MVGGEGVVVGVVDDASDGVDGGVFFVLTVFDGGGGGHGHADGE